MLKFFAFILVACMFASAKELAMKRSHHGGWGPAHCWESDSGKVLDPFCALLFQSMNCTDAPEVINGRHSQNYNRTLGSTVNYVCDDGYTMAGAEVITCEKDYATKTVQWSTPPTCFKVTCPAIPNIENGYHEASNTTDIGTTVQYFCNDGYIIDGTDTITCVTDAKKHANWSQPIPNCRETLCRLPPHITNGYAVLPNPLYVVTTSVPETTTSNETASITEQPSNTPIVPDTLNETATSLPDNSTETVNFTTSPVPIANDNATISPETFSNTSVAQPDTDNATSTAMADTSDDASTVMQDTSNATNITVPDTSNNTSTLMPDTSNDTNTVMPDMSNVTTVPDSSNETSTEQPATSNGMTTATTTETMLTTQTTPLSSTISPYIPITNETTFQINDTIIYQCNTGYGFVTSENTQAVKNSLEATCVSVNRTTTWSTTVICVPVCPSVPDVENANHTLPVNTLQGSRVDYSCFSGFEMVGPSNVTCLPTGNWSELPFCRGCMDPPVVAHGTHDMNYGTTIDSTVSYVCDDGFSMIGTEIIKCQSLNQSPYARWTAPPTCTRACGPVPTIGKGSHTVPDNLLTGANVTYSCLNGSIMLGSSFVVCQASGSWSELPVCDGVCINPPSIPNSIPTRYTYNETYTVIFTCEEHYNLVGNSTLECIAGQWSTPYPYCECQIKPVDIVFIIDGSGSLGVHGFNQTIDFVANMVKRFPIETTNFGLLTFASDVYRQFYLNEYVNDTVGLVARIKNTTYPTGGTYTFSALTYARTQMFQEQNGMRPNVTHTAIIVTDGQSSDFNETVHQAELLKAAGVTIYSVGVGLTNQDELLLIASRPSYVFTVENYDLIDQIAGPLAGITCSATHGTSDEGSGQH